MPLPSQAKRPKITGIDRWLYAFAIYSSVLLSSTKNRYVIQPESSTVWHGICMIWNFAEGPLTTFPLTGVKGMFSCTLTPLQESQKPYFVRPAAARIM